MTGGEVKLARRFDLENSKRAGVVYSKYSMETGG